MVLPDPRPPVSRDVGINVGRWVQEHYTAYTGDAAFLAGPTKRTSTLWSKVRKFFDRYIFIYI
jgi:pyruvate-formate lyase